MEAHYPIKAISLTTGLSQHVIRVWEKRYKAVEPVRTVTNRRVYTERDLAKFQLLKKATEAGHSIGQVACLSVEQLKKLVSEPSPFLNTTEDMLERTPEKLIANYLQAAIAAVKDMNGNKLTVILKQADINLSRMTFMEQVIVPMMIKIGEMWRGGSLKVAEEHIASAIVCSYLGDFRDIQPTDPNAPNIIVATPSGHLHEIGAKIVAATAAAEGWHVTYLGPNVPADDIAAVVYKHHSKAVALSFAYPHDDPRVHGELKKLKNLIPKTLAIFAGGSGANSYAQTLDDIDAIHLNNMLNFRHYLQIYQKHLIFNP